MKEFWHTRLLPRLNSALAHAGYRVFPLDFAFLLQDQLLKRGAERFFFIQVGAFDGVSQDPITRYIDRFRLRGVLVEPQPGPFETLKRNYQDHPQLILLNAAISESDGLRDFYTVRSGVPGLPDWSQQLASFNRENIVKHKHGIPEHGIPGIPNIEEYIEARKVECITFARLLELTRADTIDLLQIDAEGYDVDLVLSFPFDRLKPAIVRYEHMHIDAARQAECVRRLKRLGYRLVFEKADTTAYLP